MGECVDSKHPNVLRLTIIRSLFEQTIICILLALPHAIRDFCQALLPGYFLPSRIILKKMKPEWEDEFINEVRTYERLQPVQGHLVPKCFGVAYCDGTKALVLSEVNGVLPFEQPVDAPLNADEFRRRLEAAFGELGTFGLMYGDPKLDNCLLVDDRIVIIDLESAEEGKEEGDIEFVTESNVEFLGDRYRGYLKSRHIPW